MSTMAVGRHAYVEFSWSRPSWLHRVSHHGRHRATVEPIEDRPEPASGPETPEELATAQRIAKRLRRAVGPLILLAVVVAMVGLALVALSVWPDQVVYPVIAAALGLFVGGLALLRRSEQLDPGPDW